MKKWDYADLSHMAKVNGGPENLVKTLINSGKIKMLPWVGVAFVGGIVVDKGLGYLVAKKKQHDAEVEAAKQSLIQGINEYDAAHPVKRKTNWRTANIDRPLARTSRGTFQLSECQTTLRVLPNGMFHFYRNQTDISQEIYSRITVPNY